MKRSLIIPVVLSLAILGALSWTATSAHQGARDGGWQTRDTSKAPGPSWSTPDSNRDTRHQQPSNGGATQRRVIPYERGQPILDRIGPQDSVVEITQRLSEPMGAPIDDPNQEIDVLVKSAAAILVLRVVDIEGHLSKDEDWIMSVVHGEILEVLKNATSYSLAERSPISFEVEGGVIHQNGRELIASAGWQLLPQPSRSYLYLFLQAGGDLVPFPPNMSFDVSDEFVRRLQEGARGGLDREMATSSVLDAVRTAVNRGNGGPA